MRPTDDSWVQWVRRMFDGFTDEQCKYLREALDERLKKGRAINTAAKVEKCPGGYLPLTHDPVALFMEDLDNMDKLDAAMKELRVDIFVRKYPSFGMAKMQAKTKLKGMLKRGEITEDKLVGGVM